MTSQHGAHALHAGLARLQALMRMHTPTRPGTHMHARKHTQTNMQYLLLSHGKNSSRKRLNVNIICTLPVLFRLYYVSVRSVLIFRHIASKCQSANDFVIVNLQI